LLHLSTMADSSSSGNGGGYAPLDPESDTLSPLPAVHRRGLIACAVLGCLSFVTSTTVLLYLTVKLIRWHIRTRKQARAAKAAASGSSPQVDLNLGLAERLFVGDEAAAAAAKPSPQKKKRPHPNQFLVLIYNLLLADIHQAASFILNAVWVGRDALDVRTTTCWVQAWLIQTGDVASSLFITAIAVHTYLAIVRNYTPPQWAVYTAVVALWLFNYLLMVLGVAITDNGREYGGFFVRATAWVCWSLVCLFQDKLLLTMKPVLDQRPLRRPAPVPALPLDLPRPRHHRRLVHAHLALAEQATSSRPQGPAPRRQRIQHQHQPNLEPRHHRDFPPQLLPPQQTTP
jgi:hypothetical protein